MHAKVDSSSAAEKSDTCSTPAAAVTKIIALYWWREVKMQSEITCTVCWCHTCFSSKNWHISHVSDVSLLNVVVKIVKIQHLFKEFSKTVTLLLESKQYFHSFYVLLHHFFVRSLPVLMSFKAFFVVEVNTIIGKKTMKRDTSKSFASLAPLLWECNTKSFWHLLHLTFNNSPLLFLFRVTVVKRNMVWHNSSCSSGKAATAKTKIAGLIHCVVLLLSDTCIGLLHTIPYLNKSLTSY